MSDEVAGLRRTFTATTEDRHADLFDVQEPFTKEDIKAKVAELSPADVTERLLE